MSSGRSSRAKGVRGEHESADVFRRHGFEVVQLQNNVMDAGDYEVIPRPPTDEPGPLWSAPWYLLVDSKRRERLNMLSACQQVEAVSRNGQVPVVVWRSNRQPWRVSLPLEDFARLLGGS